MAFVTAVERGAAKRAGIKKGEEVLRFDDHPFLDLLDYAYAEGQNETTLLVRNRKGKERLVRVVKKYEDEEIGLQFDESVEIRPRLCANKCIFCFVDQLPQGMRDTLYVKDDDYRLSFISGSYVTLTNLGERDYQRILEYKLSPLYVSVHAANRELRNRMIGCPKAGEVIEALKRLTEGGIKIHAQIVLVPEYNDGTVLKETLEKLYALGENLRSVAIVPVGLTKHRRGLETLRRQTKEEACAAIEAVEAFPKRKDGIAFAFCSDEMYLLAERALPSYETYGSFDQIENGVGLVQKFLQEAEEELEIAETTKINRAAFFTGVSGVYSMERFVETVRKKFPRFEGEILPVRNRFFGETVTVTGLVTAGDIVEQYADRDFSGYDKVFLPSVMLKEFETVFLDGMSVEELEEKLHTPLTVVPTDGAKLVAQLCAEED